MQRRLKAAIPLAAVGVALAVTVSAATGGFQSKARIASGPRLYGQMCRRVFVTALPATPAADQEARSAAQDTQETSDECPEPEPQRAPGSPFKFRLTLKKTTIDPSHGPDFELLLTNATKAPVFCDLEAALHGLRFVFSPVDREGRTTVCPGPFVASRARRAKKRPLSRIGPRGGHCWNSRLNFPRELLPGSSMNRDYPTPPPGVYDLTAVMDFPAREEGWSGRMVTPPVRVTVLLSTKAKAAAAAKHKPPAASQ